MIKKVFIYLFSIPLYYLMYLIRPKKDLWIFGAWMGEKYFDNPKFLYEYIKKNNLTQKCIWITKDKNICNNLDIIYTYSTKGLYYAMKGEVFIVTHSTFSDIYPFVNNNVRKIVQLWHGIPIKKIGYDDLLHNQLTFSSSIKKSIFPFFTQKYSLIIASSDDDAINMKTAFREDDNIVKVTGYPRNDILINQKKSISTYKILYAPTLRNNLNDEINLFDNYGFNSISVFELLEKYNIELHIKMHPANKIDKKFKQSIQHSQIKFLDSKIEINEIIDEYSLLISDYSGIYVDFLLLSKAIIFAPFDYEKYIMKDRKLYYDYDEITPGPKCKDWNEVLKWIEKFKNNPTLYQIERTKIKNKFHKYQDGKSCERVYNEIIKL